MTKSVLSTSFILSSAFCISTVESNSIYYGRYPPNRNIHPQFLSHHYVPDLRVHYVWFHCCTTPFCYPSPLLAQEYTVSLTALCCCMYYRNAAQFSQKQNTAVHTYSILTATLPHLIAP
jgi:hypothetical protein